MSDFERISRNDTRIATIRDTGITVHDIVTHSLSGLTIDEIMMEFPELEPDDIQQALGYTIQRQSMARINSLQELRPEIATLTGYGDLFLVGLRSDELTSKQIAQIILNNAKMLNYKCMYQIVRARLLNPWFADIEWGHTSLGRLQSQIGTYLTPNVETVDFRMEFKDRNLNIDSRIVPITGFLTQGYTNAVIAVKQNNQSVQFEVMIPQMPEGFAPLSQVDYLARVVLQLMGSELQIETKDETICYRFEVIGNG